MAQDYKLKSFEASDFKDNNNNFWCTAVFEGVGEPLKWVVRDPTKIVVGDEYFGEIRDWTSAAGKVWPRFYREEKPEQNHGQSQGGGQTAKKEWQPRDDNAIRAQWAIGQAVSTHDWAKGTTNYGFIEERAKEFYTMVDRVKGSSDVPPQDTIAPVVEGEPFNLDDIPF